jgi:hypothetical protein
MCGRLATSGLQYRKKKGVFLLPYVGTRVICSGTPRHRELLHLDHYVGYIMGIPLG